MADSPNRYNFLVDQKRQQITQAEALLMRLRTVQDQVRTLVEDMPASHPSTAQARAAARAQINNLLTDIGMGTMPSGPGNLRRAIDAQLNNLTALRAELASLEQKRDSVDAEAAEAIEQGLDPSTAYAAAARKAELKALAMQAVRWLIYAALVALVLWGAFKLYKRTKG